MCGIAGYWDLNLQGSQEQSYGMMTAMTDPLVQHGPDRCGVWVDAEAGIALGYRRLAIFDVSPADPQPMISPHGRYAIAFNGEIYNSAELRSILTQSGHQFRGDSDPEMILAAVTAWGISAAVQKFGGMFAFALWDTQVRVLYLCRDRVGEKPLYYGWVGNTLLFGSALTALAAHPHWQGEIDRHALALFLRYGYIPAPHSIYQGISKLAPGTIISFSAAQPQTATPVAYWELQTVVKAGLRQPFLGSDSEAIEQLDTLLRQTITAQMVADVPLGACLSGGIDSATIVALMQAQSTRPVKTFSIGFTEQQDDRSEAAQAVALHLGTEHTKLAVTPAAALAVIPQLPDLADQPFADVSQIPTFLLSELTRQHVTVSLAGDGGDELFGGYSRYFLGSSIWQKISWIPLEMRRVYAQLLLSLPPEKWDQIIDRLAGFLPQLQQSQAGHKIYTIADALGSKTPIEMYGKIVSICQKPAQIVIGSKEPETIVSDPPDWLNQLDFASQMMYLDAMTYLPDDILVKVDRAAMAVSLESRRPFLDQRVIEFAWQLPLSIKLRDNQGKWILRQVLDRYVPKALIDRPKMGFNLPIDRWLRCELRDWAESLLDRQRLQQEGFFHPQIIRQHWAEHLAGTRNRSNSLWNILMFQAWLERQGTK